MEPKQSCGICCVGFGDPSEGRFKVTCSADVDPDANTGKNTILWLCQSCRLDFEKWVQHRKLAVKSDIVASKKTNVQLPVEIWATIFRKLNFKDWCNARLVSKQWKDVVDGDRLLMGNFILKFSRDDRISYLFAPAPGIPASTVIFNNNRIVNIGSWWSKKITENLVNLELNGCSLKLCKLLRMLRDTRNLVSLSLRSNLSYRVPITASYFDFQLKKMEKLTLGCVRNDAILEKLSKMCPRLKDFTLLPDYQKRYRGVLEVLRTVPRLEGISLVSSSEDLPHLIAADHRFRRVSIKITNTWDEKLAENLINFAQKQPLLESFDLDVRKLRRKIDSRVLTEVFQNFPRLKRLSIKFRFHNNTEREEDRPHLDLQFVRYLTELECLSVNGSENQTKQLLFAGARNPKLKELTLYYAYHPINYSELRDYVANAPNLRVITLNNCIGSSWSELFTAIKSEELRRLTLIHVGCGSGDDNRCEDLDGLRYLELKYCEMKEQFLSTLLGSCPRLEELHLTDIPNFCDAVVLVLCQKMKHLRKVTIDKCPITDTSVKYLTECDLEQLTIINCKKLTREGVTLLKEAKFATVQLCHVGPQRFCPGDTDDSDCSEDESSETENNV